MFDTAGWIAIEPSALRRRWQFAACALTLAIAAVLLGKASTSSAATLLLTGTALILAAAWIGWRAVAPPRESESIALRIDADGVIWLRATGHGDEAQCAIQGRFVSAQLLVLSAPGRNVGIWRDAVAADAFRRIAVACRWPGHPPAMDGQATDPA